MNPEDDDGFVPDADGFVPDESAPEPVPAGPKPSTAEANAAWAERQGPAERARLLATALDPSATPEARERARTLTRALLERHAAQATGTADTATPIVGRDERPTAGITGAAQGLTLGWADELGGAMRSQASGRTYEQERDEIRRSYAGAREQAPTATIMGELAGSTPYMLIPGAGQTAPARIATQAGIGMGLGTASGAGYSEADTAEGVAQDAAIGGTVGGVMGAGGQMVSEGARVGLDRAARFAAEADRLRVASLAPGTSREINDRLMRAASSRAGGIPGVASEVRRLGLVGPFSTAEDVLERSRRLVERRGADLDSVYRALDQIAPVESGRMVGALERQAAEVASDPIDRRFAQRVTQRAEDFAETLPESIDYSRARSILGRLGDQVSWIDPVSGARAPDTIARGSYRALRSELDDIAEEALGRVDPTTYREATRGAGNAAEAMDAFRSARRDVSSALFADEWATTAADRLARGRQISPTDYAAAMIGGQQGGGLTGAAMGAALNRMWRLREAPVVATGAEMVRALLERNPAALGRWAGPLQRAAAQGGSSLAAAHMTLSSRDPEYRRAIEQASDAAGSDAAQE